MLSCAEEFSEVTEGVISTLTVSLVVSRETGSEYSRGAVEMFEGFCLDWLVLVLLEAHDEEVKAVTDLGSIVDDDDD